MKAICSYADTSSQQARQFAANAVIDAAEAARHRAETTAHFCATFAAQQHGRRRVRRTNAAYSRQFRRTAQQLGVTLTSYASIVNLLGTNQFAILNH